MNNCQNCAKIFCKERNNVKNCDMKITFTQANIIESPKKVEKNYSNYGGITMEEACRNIQKAMSFFVKTSKEEFDNE